MRVHFTIRRGTCVHSGAFLRPRGHGAVTVIRMDWGASARRMAPRRTVERMMMARVHWGLMVDEVRDERNEEDG